MANCFIDELVQCPYYVKIDNFKNHNKWKITCQDDYGNEDPMDEYSVSIIFEKPDLRQAHMLKYCCQDYEKCKVYNLMLEKQSELNG
ncbi:hypothetical protein [Eubacterium sp.]|uniref:hypothetical protein n=1 Tax=Eubacterium sp. TaxID=142586 RepID=UPI0025CF8D9A|nr:hypothetical protein [Eubacterium sp.]MCR5629872.1 hypothetical protein [Eubacterium sp.]